MLILDILIDLVINAYISLGYGTPQRKINVKVEKLSKYHPEILDLYKFNQHIFEENDELFNLVFNSKLKSKEQRDILAKNIESFFNNYYRSKDEING